MDKTRFDTEQLLLLLESTFIFLHSVIRSKNRIEHVHTGFCGLEQQLLLHLTLCLLYAAASESTQDISTWISSFRSL